MSYKLLSYASARGPRAGLLIGEQVIDAADGLEGVKLAIAQRPDIVLVDLNIPGLDGFEVTLRLRTEASLNGVPIVAITAEGDRDTSFAVGCDGFLQKPIDARAFARQIASYIGGRRERMMSTPDVAGELFVGAQGRQHAEVEQAPVAAAQARPVPHRIPHVLGDEALDRLRFGATGAGQGPVDELVAHHLTAGGDSGVERRSCLAGHLGDRTRSAVGTEFGEQTAIPVASDPALN